MVLINSKPDRLPSNKTANNKYQAYAQFYDLIMQTGYYEHDKFAAGAKEVVQGNSTILEIGIGSGLFAEQFAALGGNHKYTGIDFSPEMLKIAKTRLKKYPSINYFEGDILKHDFNEKFDYIISMGGPISMSYRPKEQLHRIFAYSANIEEYEKLLRKLSSYLKTGGIMLVSIQEQHKDYSIALTQDVVHHQEVLLLEQYMRKTYIFEECGKEVARQTIQTMHFDEPEFNRLFIKAGFTVVGVNKPGNFYIYKKLDAK